MKTASIILTLTLAFAGFGLAEDAPVINDTCPIKGKSVDGSKAVEYTGEFCCNKCVGKFEKEPAKYVQKLADAEDGKCPFSGKDIDPDATSTVKIGVCCGNCKGKVADAPKEYLGEIDS